MARKQVGATPTAASTDAATTAYTDAKTWLTSSLRKTSASGFQVLALPGVAGSAGVEVDYAEAATADTIMYRGIGGRTSVGTPVSAADAVTKDYADALVPVARRYSTINAQTGTTYTPVLADESALVTLNNAGAITVTLPQDSSLAIPIGASIDFTVIGAGMATFTAGSGATVNATPSAITRAQYSTVSAIKRAANTWLLVGDLA